MECAAAYDLLPSGGVAAPHRRLEKHLKNRERQALLLSCVSLSRRVGPTTFVSLVYLGLCSLGQSLRFSLFFLFNSSSSGAVSLPVVQEPGGFIQSV
jgi:hypothetical protein